MDTLIIDQSKHWKTLKQNIPEPVEKCTKESTADDKEYETHLKDSNNMKGMWNRNSME